MQKNNLLGMSIVALVEAALFTALAIANNNAVIGLMAGSCHRRSREHNNQ